MPTSGAATARDNRWHSDGSLLYQFLPDSSIGLIWAHNDGVNHTYRSYGGAYYYYPGDYRSRHERQYGAADLQ